MDSMEGYLRANNLELKYRIEAETFSGRKFSRVHFAHGLAEKPHVVERNIQLRGVRNGTEQCFEETAFVKVCFLFSFSLAYAHHLFLFLSCNGIYRSFFSLLSSAYRNPKAKLKKKQQHWNQI